MDFIKVHLFILIYIKEIYVMNDDMKYQVFAVEVYPTNEGSFKLFIADKDIDSLISFFKMESASRSLATTIGLDWTQNEEEKWFEDITDIRSNYIVPIDNVYSNKRRQILWGFGFRK